MTDEERGRPADELATVIGQLSRRLRAASSEGALTPSQVSVLGRLGGEGPASTAALARAELVRPQSMRMTLAALEERGLIARAPHPTDGRQVVFSLTDAGTCLRDTAPRSRRGWLADAIDAELTPAERDTLTAAIPLLRRLVQA
ncbi:MarR family winged helix-turn-helix transcriptional regulator [Streptomyces sp.]|uniref:MarR family winged helix-turn-helix transcriptional regulator n=1 Tax=Streptomyces sp. TaxID=1931 RepID=UPI002F425E19